jgi:hypothetical protein
MPTIQQIEQFKIKARRAGFSEQQIAQEVARKQQEETRTNIQTQPTSGNQTNRGTLVQNITGGKGIAGLAENVGNFIAPATQNIMKDAVASSVVSSKGYKQANESVRAAQKQAQDLIKRANKTKDKDLKKKYLDLARQLNNQASFNPDTEEMFSEDVNKDNLSRGLASAVEIGSGLLTPKGIGSNGLKRTVSAAVQGAALSGGRTATSLKEMTPEERLEATKNSALMGGAITGGIQAVGDVSKFIKGKGKTLEAGGEKVREGVRQIKQPPSIYGAGKEKAINKSLTERGFKGTPAQQYEQLEPAMASLEDEVQDIIKKNPDITVKVGDIKTSFIKNLKSALRSKDLTASQAKSEIEGYLNDLIKASGGKGKFTNIDLGRLRQLKKLVNEDFGPVYTAMENGTALTPRQKVIAAAWDSLDEAVKGASPELKKLLEHESNLYKAARSLYSARFNPPTLRAFGTSAPASVTQAGTDIAGRAMSGAGRAIGKLPTITETGALEAGKKLIPSAIDSLTPSVPEQAQNEEDKTQYQGGQDYTASDFEHEDSIASQSHPIFGNTTKQEVLTDAFKKGANSKQLDEIEKIYDRFAPQGSVLTEDMQKSASTLRSEYLSQTKQNNYMDMTNAYRKVLTSPDTAAGQLSLIFAYMKMLDPGSVVREAEFSNAETAQNIIDRYRLPITAANAVRLYNGKKLGEQARKEFIESSKIVYQSYAETQKQIDDLYSGFAKQSGIDPKLLGIGAIGIK